MLLLPLDVSQQVAANKPASRPALSQPGESARKPVGKWSLRLTRPGGQQKWTILAFTSSRHRAHKTILLAGSPRGRPDLGVGRRRRRQGRYLLGPPSVVLKLRRRRSPLRVSPSVAARLSPWASGSRPACCVSGPCGQPGRQARQSAGFASGPAGWSVEARPARRQVAES